MVYVLRSARAPVLVAPAATKPAPRPTGSRGRAEEGGRGCPQCHQFLSPVRGRWCCQDSLTEPVELEVIVGEKASQVLGSRTAVGLALGETQKELVEGSGTHLGCELCAGAEKNHPPAVCVTAEGVQEYISY